MNSVPDKAVIGVDIRTIPGQDNNKVYEELQTYLGEEVELKRIVDVGGICTDPQDDWTQQVFGIMEKILQERPLVRGATYFTDASVLAPSFDNPPTVIIGPGELTMAHRTDEFCYISKIEVAVDAYIEIAKKWCNL